MCDKLHTHIKGRVLSSLKHQPVVLTAIMVGTEVATFTDENGYFSFDLSTSNGDVLLIFQETHHRILKRVVNIRHSKSPEINVVLEYVETSLTLERLSTGSDITLSSDKVEGTYVNIKIAPKSLISKDTLDMYEGTGKLLYSLYNSKNRPEFTSEALNTMLYTDSQGVEFSIQAYLICSMEMHGESGHLVLRSGTMASLKVILNFDMNIVGTQVSNLHLFVYSEEKSRWLDNGKVGLTAIEKQPNQYGSSVTIHQTLHEVNLLWIIGHPVRISCYLKAMVTNRHTHRKLPDTILTLTQSDTSLSRATHYQYTSSSTPASSVCLKAVCALGGTIKVSAAKGDQISAIPPSVDVGMVMGDKEQIMFYDTDKEWGIQVPYYKTEKECQSAEKPYFEFTSNRTVRTNFPRPNLLPLINQRTLPPSQNQLRDYCFVKVSVYDCAPLTEIKVLSYSSTNHHELLSMHTGVAMGTNELNTCRNAKVVNLRASCVEFTCNSDAHITVQSQNHYDTYTKELTSQSSKGHSIDCRYWSSNRNIPINYHPSENMKSFHLNHKQGLSTSSGVYRGTSSNLALMQCMSGNEDAPESVVDPHTGVAVIFTCLL